MRSGKKQEEMQRRKLLINFNVRLFDTYGRIWYLYSMITKERGVIPDMDGNADSDSDTNMKNIFCSMQRYE